MKEPEPSSLSLAMHLRKKQALSSAGLVRIAWRQIVSTALLASFGVHGTRHFILASKYGIVMAVVRVSARSALTWRRCSPAAGAAAGWICL